MLSNPHVLDHRSLSSDGLGTAVLRAPFVMACVGPYPIDRRSKTNSSPVNFRRHAEVSMLTVNVSPIAPSPLCIGAKRVMAGPSNIGPAQTHAGRCIPPANAPSTVNTRASAIATTVLTRLGKDATFRTHKPAARRCRGRGFISSVSTGIAHTPVPLAVIMSAYGTTRIGARHFSHLWRHFSAHQRPGGCTGYCGAALSCAVQGCFRTKARLSHLSCLL